jgi:hypothetical protein
VQLNTSRNSAPGRFSGKRSVWLGLLAGAVTLAGASVVLKEFVLFMGRTLAVSTDRPGSWSDTAHVAGTTGWFAVQAVLFLAAALAAFVGDWLAPPRSAGVLVGLLLLVLMALFFAQLPSPRTGFILSVWALCQVLGVFLGTLLHRLVAKRAA